VVFLDGIRESLKSGEFRPVEVRQVMIPKKGSSGKLRKLGIPTVADRVVQTALKAVLEPIFEADFKPCSYGFRPNRRAQDAIAEIHFLATHGYEWVLEADIEACLDALSYCFPSDCHGWNSVCSGVGGSMRSPFRRPVRT
jgi:RNA-directed DNA polymerase